MKQLTFPLPYETSYRLENFYVSASNQNAFETVRGEWPSHKLILTGARGAGKSHLAAIWAAQKGAAIIEARALDEAWLCKLSADYVVVENVAAAFSAKFEKALFHLHNMVVRSGGGMLMTSRTEPSAWRIGLADLRSRIDGTGVVGLPNPDDALLRAVLAKHFSDRQIVLAPNILEYAIKRMERSLEMVHILVEHLDRVALESKAPITMGLVREFFEGVEGGG